jgi:hypothetical protein
VAQVFEHLAPIEHRQLAQAGEGVADGGLGLGLARLLLEGDLGQRLAEDAFEPTLHRAEGGVFVVQVVDQLRGEVGRGRRVGGGELGHHAEEGGRIAAADGEQAVGPEVGELALAQVGEGMLGVRLDAFDQGDAQHLRVGPQLADRERDRSLVGLEEGDDVVALEASVGVGRQLGRQAVDARQRKLPICKCRELAVVAARQIKSNIPGVGLDDVLVVEDPFGDGGRALVETGGGGQVEADLVDPVAGGVEAAQELGVALRVGVEAVVSRQADGVRLELRQGKGGPISKGGPGRSRAFRVNEEQDRWDLAGFAQDGSRLSGRVYRALQDEERLVGDEAASVCPQQTSLDAEAAPPEPYPGDEQGGHRARQRESGE